MSVIINNLSKIYGTQKALNNINLRFKPGEITGLLGPNGAGKTTMMRIITCFIPPTSGDVSVCGYNNMLHPLEVRRKIGYLPENNPLYTEMYVREFLKYNAGIYKINDAKNRINQMIELTGLQNEQKKKISALSKGYRQRVGLAQALLHDPDVLILDEPTSGLDPNQIIEIRNLIKKSGTQKTVILSTHIMQEVEAICDRVVIINKGEIIKDDITENLHKITSGNIILTVEFSSSVISKGMLETIPGVISASNIKANTWTIQTPSNIDIRNEIFNLAVKNNTSILSMQKEEQSLEQVFQQLTKNQ